APSKQRAGSLRDYFYDRLMFPILDAKGSVVAFGGRTLGDGEPKYLNSAETPVFSKSRLLYGLSKAASSVRKSRRALLMEGYMDVIAAHQHGLESACAPLGTALTSEHAALLGRYCSEAVIVFDCDDAGLNAAARGAELLLSRGLSVRIATVEGGKDPDEVLHEKGAGALRSSLEAAADLVRFKTELLIRRRDQPLSAEAKSAIAKEVLATIGQSPDEILKAEWLDRLARRLRIPVEALSREGRRLGGASRPAVARAAAEAALPGPDEELLLHVLKEPRLSALACESDFSSASARALWSALRALEPWRPGWSLALAEGLEPDSRERAQRLLVKADELIGKEAEARLRRILEKGRRERRYEELRGMLQEGGDVDATITDEFIRLSAELKGSAAAKA
ncbi:MAG: toprim domain-containing protein, partial [Elusimicrobia bacterium]|nr:toprim domain-containing protein [Elusimicrobiota bacterium]